MLWCILIFAVIGGCISGGPGFLWGGILGWFIYKVVED